jgi:hypothetical protein
MSEQLFNALGPVLGNEDSANPPLLLELNSSTTMEEQLVGLDLEPSNSRSAAPTAEQASELSKFNTGKRLKKKSTQTGEVAELFDMMKTKLKKDEAAAEERAKEAQAERERLTRSEERDERFLNAVEKLVVVMERL